MSLRLAFMGTPDFAVPTLARLFESGHEVAATYSQPARPKGRGYETQPSPVAKFAHSRGLEVRTPSNLKSEEVRAELAALALDAAVVVAYGLILPKPILAVPRLGSFNLHASLLPRWRGAAPIQRAIMAGDEETGVMVMRMEEGLDAGPVLMAERVKVARKTAGELSSELAERGADLVVRALSALEFGGVEEHLQSEHGVTYAKKISKEETRIDWTKSVREVDCLIRGISPSPGAWCEFRGERLKILFAEPVAGHGTPGQILDNAPTVACGDGALRLVSLQRAGRAVMEAAEFQRGFPLAKGDWL